MFRFFKTKKWLYWSWLGSLTILFSLWFQVKIDVKINEWFGQFYDMIQKALSAPNSITTEEYFSSLLSFITLAGIYVGVYVVIKFFSTSCIKLSHHTHHAHKKYVSYYFTYTFIIIDFRKPNVFRIAPNPLYNSYSDIYNFVNELEKI